MNYGISEHKFNEYSIIGVGSVVTKDIPGGVLVLAVGNPELKSYR